MFETQKNTLWSCTVTTCFYKLCREVYISVGYRQFETEECIFVRYENNVKTGSVTDKDGRTLTSLEDMQEIPLSDRVYQDCPNEIAVVIILLYVDNMTKTTQKFGEYAEQVVRYVGGRRDAKLTWCSIKAKVPLRPGDVGSFADSSWTDVKSSRKSTNCHYILCNNALVYWRSKIASILATSTPEGELISVVSCAQDVAFCRKLADELGFK